MAPAWDSDSESEVTLPPLNFNFKDPEIYKHLKKHRVLDAVERERVDSDTVIASLYDYSDGEVDNQLVRSLARSGEVEVPCQIELSNGQFYPPTTTDGQHGCYFFVGYNKLYFAPAIRLVCKFVRDKQSASEPYLQLVLEFHFNDFSGNDSGIRDHTVSDVGLMTIITFSARKATCSGFNSRRQHESSLSKEENKVIQQLLSYLDPEEQQTVKLRLEARKGLLEKIFARLPGGNGILLPTIGQVEYAAFGRVRDNIKSKRHEMLKPRALIAGSSPLPMVPLESTDTFATIKEAAVQLAYSVAIQDTESREALRLWASPSHRGRLFRNGTFAVLAVNFKKFQKLGSVDRDINYKLPRDLACSIHFTLPGPERKKVNVAGFLMENNPGFERHDAFFQITSQPLKFFAKAFSTEKEPSQEFDVDLDPHFNSFTFGSQLDTVTQLQRSENERWHGILLNQIHDAIPTVDLTRESAVTAEAKAAADKWLREWMSWNAEQLQVIEGIKSTKGGLVIVMGPAGTGKTLLQEALTVYFYKLGFHILALAPANSNCNHLASEMHKIRSQIPGLAFNRLFPGSKDIPLEDLTEEQAAKRQVGHEKGNVLPFPELLIALDEQDKVKDAARAYGIVESIIAAADEGKVARMTRLRDEHRRGEGERVDAWDVLRSFMREYREGRLDEMLRKYCQSKLDLEYERSFTRYKEAYRACKSHIVGINRFMITTTGNVRSTEMLEQWFRPEEEYDVPRVGVMVFVDEAAKDLEVNVWSGIVCEEWADMVRGVFLFGDDKQLKPTNTSAKGTVQFNFYSDRLDIPLPCRLVREGFPYYRLVEQRRMHQSLAKFANENIYGKKLRNGPGIDEPLDEKLPGFKDVLLDIQADCGYDNEKDRKNDMHIATEKDARLHYIQVYGERVTGGPNDTSLVVRRHVDVFFDRIFPKLLAYFKERDKPMEKHVMVICAYSCALFEYKDRIKVLLKSKSNLTDADMPRILTVDASQGQESPMVILDGSWQHSDVIGFMADERRYNVAITRAREVFWTIGGNMDKRFPYGPRVPPNLATKYKRELDERGMVRRVKQ